VVSQNVCATNGLVLHSRWWLAHGLDDIVDNPSRRCGEGGGVNIGAGGLCEVGSGLCLMGTRALRVFFVRVVLVPWLASWAKSFLKGSQGF
jgi:hypothetical protein